MAAPWGGTGSEFWDTYYGGGYGTGQSRSGSSYQSYPQTNAAPQSSSSSGGGSSSGIGTDDWLDLARLGLGVYQSTRRPSFTNQPLSPEERKLYDLYFKLLMNPALKDNASNVNEQTKQILNGYNGIGWQSPPMTNAHVPGYGGTRTPMTPLPTNSTQSGQTSAPGLRNGGQPVNGFNVDQHRVNNRTFISSGEIPGPSGFGSGMTPGSNVSLDPTKPTLYRPPGSTASGLMNAPTGPLPQGMSPANIDASGLVDFAKRWGPDAVAAITGFLKGGPLGAVGSVVLREYQRAHGGKKP